MPVFRGSTIVELARGVRAFLSYEAGITRGPVSPGAESPRARRQDRAEISRLRRALEEERKRAARPQPALDDAGPDPAGIVWVFGTGRTGSTWLSRMMGDLPDHQVWNEPLIGRLFGGLYHSLREDRRTGQSFVLGGNIEARRASIRAFVLAGAAVRYPAFSGGGHLVIKEPSGSAGGAPLLVDALPESRVIFLVRDFRDVLASYMDALKPGGWMYNKRDEDDQAALAKDPHQVKVFRNRVKRVAEQVATAKEAYDAHRGPKALVRYEDLKADTLGTMKRIYSALEIPVDEDALERVVKEHSWENVPEEKKGPGKFYRKAASGTWRDDLTPQQAAIVDAQLTPLVNQFYPS